MTSKYRNIRIHSCYGYIGDVIDPYDRIGTTELETLVLAPQPVKTLACADAPDTATAPDTSTTRDATVAVAPTTDEAAAPTETVNTEVTSFAHGGVAVATSALAAVAAAVAVLAV